MGAYGLTAPVPTETPLGTRHAHLELGGESRAVGAGSVSTTSREAAAAMDQARAAARGQAEAYYEAVDAANKLAEAQSAAAMKTSEAYTSVAKDVVGGFIQDMRNGVSAADAFANALNRLADRLIDMALDTVFNPANFASLFAGAPMDLTKLSPRANGGPVRRGGGYLVGERGPEMFVPSSAGSIIPNQRLAAGGGRGGDANVSVNVINASGEKVETRERRTDLGRTVEVMVGKAIGSGKFDPQMGSRYGAKPLTTRRGK
jgi:phage-related minor tail protein